MLARSRATGAPEAGCRGVGEMLLSSPSAISAPPTSTAPATMRRTRDRFIKQRTGPDGPPSTLRQTIRYSICCTAPSPLLGGARRRLLGGWGRYGATALKAAPLVLVKTLEVSAAAT